MSAKAVSPGAALLRTSRLFSLPSQLPPAPGDVTGAGKRLSESATKPFPTLQAIASPKASRSRGDWGFKRPLPSKVTTKSTAPLVRVKQVDSIEQITDFATATDHAVTLRKWQEMGVPITLQTDAQQHKHLPGKSVFEEAADMIAIEPSKKHTTDDKRWKFQGPWLAGITEGAFQTYLKKQVRTRRPEFRDFLRVQLATDINRDASAKAMDAGTAAVPPVAAADITDAQLTEYLRKLRQDRPLLYRLVGKFLDLAPLEPSDKIFQSLARSSFSLAGSPSLLSSSSAATSSSLSPLSPLSHLGSSRGAANPWAQDGPPITHPSAGLSYLRTAAYLDNHPLYGPQKSHPPVQARVVSPRNASGSFPAKLGVGGFVTDNPFGETAYHIRNSNSRTIPGLSIIDPKIAGGSKIPMRVSAAKVNSQGRVVVSVTEADPEAVLVQRELEGKETIFGQPARLLSTRTDSYPRSTVRYAQNLRQSALVSSPQNYGLGP
ncbi:hypothetical protein CMQ_3658 [Grosmannia clavigera kw1407]|uniref:Mitochondrial ribosomal protein n=1 Tax=Grosmannia clavigera (strain kw1407 / UAMH 11150) TaxID=655863 RepID=F0X8K2_GROCL|nr:uncharacterized protein CMQ_3658 [Grosmannia clavigera kw1407]EFX05589.1 hypothetical protein CMQ_3658 [Grosmannia clavigera kw1407]